MGNPRVSIRLVGLLLGLGVLSGLATVLLSVTPERTVAWLETLILGLVLGLPLLWLVVRGESLIQPVTVFSVIAGGYVLGAIFLLAGGHSITFSYQIQAANLPYFSSALKYALLGSVFYFLGYFLFCRPETEAATSQHRARYGKSRLYWAVASLSAVGLAGYISYVSSSGGLLFLLQNIHRRALLRSSDYTRAFFQFFQVAGWLWFVVDDKAPRRPLFWLHTLLTFLMLGSTGSRTAVILHLFGLVVLSFLRRPKRWITPARLFQGAVVGVLLASIVLGVVIGFVAWRRAASAARLKPNLEIADIQRSLESFNDAEALARMLFGQGNAASIETLATMVENVPAEIPHLYGASFSNIPLAAVPRSLWPEKPVNLGLQFNRAVEDPQTVTGRPVSWIGELYWNFGAAAVVLGCLFFGMASAAIRNWYLRVKHIPTAVVGYMVFVVYFTAFLTKIELKTALNRTIFYLLAIGLAAVILGRPRRAIQRWRLVPNGETPNGLPGAETRTARG